MHKKIFICIGVILLINLPTLVTSIGVAVSPTTLEYENALKGGPNQKQFMVFNQEGVDAYYEIYAEGDTSGWFSFDPEPPVKVNAKSSARIIVVITPPADTPNGIYEDMIYIKLSTNVTGGEGAVVGISPAVVVKTIINITGKEVISGIVHKISAENNEIGMPIKFLIRYSNTGNVRSGPKIIIKISKGREHIDTVEKEITLSAGQNKDILIGWETLNQEAGDYVANVEVLLNNKKIADERVLFKILPKGALIKNVSIINVTAPKTIRLGELAKIEVLIKNTGAGGISAKMKSEIYLGDELVNIIEGDAVSIMEGGESTLKAYFKPEKAGGYVIKGGVFYEGKEAKIEGISIFVTEAGGEENPTAWTNTIIILVIIAIIGALILFIKKGGEIGRVG